MGTPCDFLVGDDAAAAAYDGSNVAVHGYLTSLDRWNAQRGVLR